MTLRPIEDLRGPCGRLEAILNAGRPGVHAAAIVCHPHPAGGGTMHNKVVYHAMKALTSLGVPVLRFNFRGVGLSEGVHDHGLGEQDDLRAAVAWMAGAYPGARLIAAGFSFGAAVILRACCAESFPDSPIAALIALGLPVHAAGRDYTYGFLAQCTPPKLFISGDSDQYAPLPQLQSAFALAADPKHTVIIPGAEHFFQGTPANPGPKLDSMQAAIRDWLPVTLALTPPPPPRQ